MTARLEAVFGWAVRSRIAYAVILIFGLALYLPGFTTLPAIDRDEARFAQASRQMLESHDFIDIRNGETARLKKPAGIYWLQAAATALAGGEYSANPIWTYRLPSLIGALGAILTTLAIGRRWFGVAPGFAAAALLAASPVLGYEARQADTDAVLLLTILIALAGLAAAWIPAPAEGPLSRWRWVGVWAAIGIGILIKGPVILMVVGLAAATLAIFDRNLDAIKRLRPWPGVAIAAFIALPWLIAITIATKGAFLTESVGTDMMAKLASGQESHGAPPGSYLLEFPVGFWPGSLFAVLALPWVWRNRRDRAVLFCLAWIVPAWIVFEIIPTKLPRYVLPLYPGVALLAGTALTDRLALAAAASRHWFNRAVIALWALIGLVSGGAVIAVAPLGDGRLSIRGIVAALALWAVTAAGAREMWRGQAIRAASVSLAGMVVAWALVFGAALPALDAPWIAPRLKEVLFEKLPTGHGPILVAGYAEPSAMIALGTATRFGGGADAARLLADNADGVAIVSADQQADFMAALTQSGTAFTAIGTVSGFNYAKGKRVTLTLYRRTPQ